MLLKTRVLGKKAHGVAEQARGGLTTGTQERVQDIATLVGWLTKRKFDKIAVIGSGEAGLWALLAAPLADVVSADCSSLDLTTDEALLTHERYVPCLRRMGDFATAAMLGAPHPLLLYNTGDKFSAVTRISATYKSLAAPLKMSSTSLSEDAVMDWVVEKL